MPNRENMQCPGYESEMANVFYNTTATFNYCVPNADEAKEVLKEIFKELDDNIGGFGNYIIDIKDAWLVLLFMAFVAPCITVFYVWLLKTATKPLLYTSLVLIFLFGCATGYFAYLETQAMPNKESHEYMAAVAGSFVIWIIVVLYTCFIVCNWRNIALGASIMETASDFVTEN